VSDPGISDERVAMRVSQGGHDVPSDKIYARYPRTLRNLKAAINELPHIRIYDNDDLRRPYRLVAAFENGQAKESYPPMPQWLASLLTDGSAASPSI
jgi:predicted ABC-type ATPase